ncbi:hypothetical protein R1sor_010784 [Riccia sorocarpa]|uniref:DUF7869 domain-containing protein n=1 Tax=Riccia sorocarpa TaxID=122646 RepID=A0ABD3HZ33_9MARC
MLTHGRDPGAYCHLSLTSLWPGDPNFTVTSLAKCLRDLEQVPDDDDHTGDLSRTTSTTPLFASLLDQTAFKATMGNEGAVDSNYFRYIESRQTHAVRETETTFKKLPPIFMLQMDNSAKDNKNQHVLAFCSELVILGVFEIVEVDGHILVPTGEPKALQLPTSHPRLGEVSPFIDNLIKCLQETYNDPTSEGYRKYIAVVEYWKTLKRRLTNIDSLPSDTLQTRFWPKTDHGTSFNPLVVSGETAVTAVISGDLVVDDLERELNEENDVQLQRYVGDPADRPKRAFVPLEDISEGKFVILHSNDDFEAQIPRTIWLGRAMGSVVRDTNDEHHGEFLVEWWRPWHRKSMNATDKERYSAILVGQKDWEKDPGYVRPQWINASAAIYSWKYRSKEAVSNSTKLNPLAKAAIKSHFDRLDLEE